MDRLRGPARDGRTYSFSTCSTGRFAGRRSANKLVVLGPSASNLQDVHPTSTRRRGDAGRRDPGERDRHVAATASRCAAAPGWLDFVLIVALRPDRAALRACAARAGARRRRAAVGGAVRRRGSARLQQRARGARSPTRCSRSSSSSIGVLGDRVPARGVRARAHARHVLALRARGGRRLRCSRAPDGELRLGGERVEGTVHVHRPARLHDVLRGLAAEEVIGLLNGYLGEISDAMLDARRHARLLPGRRDHGRVRRAAAAGRPRRPGARRGARDARGAPAAVQRDAARAGLRATASRWGSG